MYSICQCRVCSGCPTSWFQSGQRWHRCRHRQGAPRLRPSSLQMQSAHGHERQVSSQPCTLARQQYPPCMLGSLVALAKGAACWFCHAAGGAAAGHQAACCRLQGGAALGMASVAPSALHPSQREHRLATRGAMSCLKTGDETKPSIGQRIAHSTSPLQAAQPLQVCPAQMSQHCVLRALRTAKINTQ